MADYFFDEEEEESKEEIEFKDDLLNYRGYFVENGDEEKKFYEYGAHFPYMYLYQRLEILAQERKANKNALENKLKKKEENINNNEESKETTGVNEETKPKENLKNLLNIFKQKGKSRNRGDVDIGLTYMPKLNKKKEEQINLINDVAADLIKSSAGQKEESKNNENIKNIKKNYMTKNEELINENSKFNNYINKNEINNKKNNNIIIKKVQSGNQRGKIRKRNENKIWNINNSLNGNITISLNLLNRTKFGEKNNSKNMTHDIPYMAKITNNLVNKLKSIQFPKEKLRKQILNTGKREPNKNKNGQIKKIINKIRNVNNKGSYSNNYGYQNTKNTSSSKNLIKNKKKNNAGISSNVNPINEKLDIKNKINHNANMKNNIISRNIINNNKSIKQNNFLSNIKNNSKNIYNINKNLLKINNISSNNNISLNNQNPNQKNKIPNKNYRTNLLKKETIKSATSNKNKIEFIESIGSKKAKNNVSRNNNVPIFNNQVQSTLNKNFHSVNNPNKNIKKAKPNHVNINLTNNFSNLNQQLNSQTNNKIKEINYRNHKNCSSNYNLKKLSPGQSTKKKGAEKNINKNPKTKNINNIQEQFKSYLLKINNIKNNLNMNNNKKVENKSIFKNNALINMDNTKNKKKDIVSRNRKDNDNIETTSKKNNTMMQNKKKHHININININNQQNIILNKLGNGSNNNSVNICSVRSSNNKEVIKNKIDKNGNYYS